MTLLSLQQELEKNAGKKLKLTVNDNRSTMLSVKWEPDCTKVSLHRMFLNAPRNIMDDLACYLRQEKTITPSVKAFIENNLQKLNYSHQLDIRKLNTQGNVYNLKQIFYSLNKEYFENSIELYITWFGKPNQKNKSKVTFGLYYEPLKLIKIHKILDSPLFPDYFVSYVVYHEMLHHVCPSYFENGLHRVHTKEFKAREQQYRHYDLAQAWIAEHQNYFFE